jgi:hypothetical protein
MKLQHCHGSHFEALVAQDLLLLLSSNFILSVWPKVIAAGMAPQRVSARSAILEERSWNAIWRLSSLTIIHGKES